MFHQHIAALVVNVVFLPGVDVLHIALVVHQVRDGPDEMPTGAEHLKHRPALPVKGQPVVELHLARQPGVVAGPPVQEIGRPLHHRRDALAPALVKDGRVRDALNDPPPEQRVVLLHFPDLSCLLHRVDAQALVGASGAAVQFLDAVEPPLFVRRVPSHRERLGEAEIVAPVNFPVLRDGKRRNDMGPALILIVGRVVPPLGEHLPLKAVPAAVEQGLLFRFRQAGQSRQIIRVVFQQGRVIEHAGRNEHPRPFQFFLRAVRHPHRVFFHDRRTGRGRCDEPGLDPAVPHPAGVGGGPEIHPSARAGRAVAAHQVAVLFPFKVGELIKADKIKGLALIVRPVFGVLQGAKINLRPAGEHPHMAGGVVLRPGECPAVVQLAFVHKVGQLRVSLAEDEGPVVRDVHLPQRLDHQRVALAAACRPAVEGFRLRPPHKFQLPRLGPPDHGGSFWFTHASSTDGSSTTPQTVPSASTPCSFSALATAARSFKTAVASFSPLKLPGSAGPSLSAAFLAVFCRAFSSRTSCASKVLRVSVARCKLSMLLLADCFVCPILDSSLPFLFGLATGYHRVPPSNSAHFSDTFCLFLIRLSKLYNKSI